MRAAKAARAVSSTLLLKTVIPEERTMIALLAGLESTRLEGVI